MKEQQCYFIAITNQIQRKIIKKKGKNSYLKLTFTRFFGL